MAEWTTAYVNDLPDSSFLYIEPGGEKDEDGRTKPRSLRHFPVKDADGKVDLPHLRNALSRIPQSSLPAAVKDKAAAEAARMLENAQKEAAAKVLDARVVKVAGVSFDTVSSAICAALLEKYPQEPSDGPCCDYSKRPWVRDVFDDVAIYGLEGKLYRVPYTYSAGTATLAGAEEEVMVTYSPVAQTAAVQLDSGTKEGRAKLAKRIDATIRSLAAGGRR